MKITSSIDMRRSGMQRGFSLIELLVSLLIGLIVLNGVIQIVLNSKRSYLDNQAMSQLQENARYALDLLSRDIRMAGYFGCATPEDRGIKFEPGMSSFLVGTSNELEGFSAYENVADFPVEFKTGVYTDSEGRQPSDAIIIRFSDVYSENIVKTDAARTSGQLELKASAGLKGLAPSVLVARDCSEGLVFEPDDFADGATTIGGMPTQGQSDITLAPFTAGARVSRILAHGYYIGDSRIVPGTPALMREVLQPNGSTKSEELALGVENLNIEYGILSGGKIIYADESSSLSLKDVSVVRIGVALRSLEKVHAEDFPATNLGLAYEDRYLRQEVFTTVRIRNRSS